MRGFQKGNLLFLRRKRKSYRTKFVRVKGHNGVTPYQTQSMDKNNVLTRQPKKSGLGIDPSSTYFVCYQQESYKIWDNDVAQRTPECSDAHYILGNLGQVVLSIIDTENEAIANVDTGL